MASAVALLALDHRSPAAPGAALTPPAPLPARFIPLLGVSACLSLAIGLLALLLTRTTHRPTATPAPRRSRRPRSRLCACPGGRPRHVFSRGFRPRRTGELTRDLIGFWPFDDGPGSPLAVDLSGGPPCQLRGLDPGAAWSRGRARRARWSWG
jgi:hypothetical protein